MDFISQKNILYNFNVKNIVLSLKYIDVVL